MILNVNNNITKAVVPVAGMGTRVMPLSLHQPKGMIAVVDKPVIHYIIDDLINAGIKEIILVISPGQNQFKKYFDHLIQKDSYWSKIKFRIIVQKYPRGNGDAIFIAAEFLGQKPFVVCFGDEIEDGEANSIKKLIDVFQKTKSPSILLKSEQRSLLSRYGVVTVQKTKAYPNVYKITGLVEKPKIEKAPSNLRIIGRYVLTSDILKEIKTLYSIIPKNKELYLTDALISYIKNGGQIYGWQFKGPLFDCGSKIGILKAQIHFGLRHPEFKKEFKKYVAIKAGK